MDDEFPEATALESFLVGLEEDSNFDDGFWDRYSQLEAVGLAEPDISVEDAIKKVTGNL